MTTIERGHLRLVGAVQRRSPRPEARGDDFCRGFTDLFEEGAARDDLELAAEAGKLIVAHEQHVVATEAALRTDRNALLCEIADLRADHQEVLALLSDVVEIEDEISRLEMENAELRALLAEVAS